MPSKAPGLFSSMLASKLFKRRMLCGLVILLSVGLLSASFVTMRAAAQTAQAPSVRYDFQFIRQGQMGLVEIDGANLTGATAVAMGHTYVCYPTSTGAACPIAVPMAQAIKDTPLSITINHADGTTTPWSSSFAVASGQFIATNFVLPGNLMYLTRDDIQINEDDRLLSAYSIITPTRYWDGGFTPPVKGGLIAPFGEVRSYTGSLAIRRHTGQDLQASMGTPVLASANGRVVLSRLMDIHGNNIIIDHGWGIYSEYAHLSQRYVVPGQFVLQGDVIGLSGNTGRSTGPHVHWEISVDDVWVNPIEFAKIKLPQ